MQAHNRGKDTQLVPAQGQLIVAVAEDVAADIMTPPTIADIAGRRREIRLEVQRFPGHVAVAREAHWIAVATRSGITREGNALRATGLNIVVVIVVEHPEWVHALDGLALLPVNPPEVYPLLFFWMVQVFEISF